MTFFSFKIALGLVFPDAFCYRVYSGNIRARCRERRRGGPASTVSTNATVTRATLSSKSHGEGFNVSLSGRPRRVGKDDDDACTKRRIAERTLADQGRRRLDVVSTARRKACVRTRLSCAGSAENVSRNDRCFCASAIGRAFLDTLARVAFGRNDDNASPSDASTLARPIASDRDDCAPRNIRSIGAERRRAHGNIVEKSMRNDYSPGRTTPGNASVFAVGGRRRRFPKFSLEQKQVSREYRNVRDGRSSRHVDRIHAYSRYPRSPSARRVSHATLPYFRNFRYAKTKRS